MKNIINKVAIILACLIPSLSFGQSSQPSEREVVMEALSSIEDYKTFITLRDLESLDEFTSLFVSDSVLIYNDFIGFKLDKKLTLKQYTDFQYKNIKSPIISITNIKKDRIWNDNDTWKAQISYDKSLSYENVYNVHFSTSDFYDKNYREIATLVYDKERKKCLIENITGKIDSDKIFPSDYYVLLSNSDFDKSLLYKTSKGTRRVQLNRFNQMFLVDGVNKKQFVYPDPDVSTIIKVNDESRTVSLSYKPRRWRLAAHIDIPVGEYYKIDNNLNNITTKTSGMEFGLDAGYIIPSKNKIKFSVNMGLGFAKSSIDLSMSAYDYSYNASKFADADKDEYVRYYNIYGGSESISMTHINIPIYVDAEWNFSRVVSAYAQVGIKPYLNIGSSLDSYSLDGYTYGIYPQYENLRLDEHWSPIQFGERKFGTADVTDNTISLNSFSLDAILGAGFRVKPVSSIPLSLSLGIGYQLGLTDAWKKGDHALEYTLTNSGYRTNADNAILSYTDPGQGGIGERVRMLNDAITSAKRLHLKINIALIYKF